MSRSDVHRRASHFARYAVRRSRQLLVERDARDAVRARTHLRALRELSPNLQVVGVDDDGATTFVLASDEVITPLLLARGHFQRDDFVHAKSIVERLAPRPDASAFVDVGANVGTTTLYAARSGSYSRIVSVEPSPENVRVIHLNIHANDLKDLVEVVDAACGSSRGEVELMLSAVSAGDHRVRRTGESLSTHPTSVTVQQRTLDEILAGAGLSAGDVSLVWVDTQGHEPAVLTGADMTIEGGAPFVVEFWPEVYARAGTLEDYLLRLEASFDLFVDLREPGEVKRPMSDLQGLARRLQAERNGQTDLVLLHA